MPVGQSSTMEQPSIPMSPISMLTLPPGSMLDNMMGVGASSLRSAASALPAVGRGNQTQAIRILLVQSCDSSRQSLLEEISQIERTAEAFGLNLPLEVCCASTGEEAFDLLTSSRRFDIALVEIGLPGISGLDLSWWYQQGVGSRSDALDMAPTVMVACSSDASELLARKADKALYQAGMQDAMTLPVTTPALRHMLHKWLPRRSRTGSEWNLLSLNQPRGLLDTRVLHVESCAVTAAATSCLLQELGMWIDTAEDGEAAMILLSGGRTFDLVITEVNLPGMSGYALCSWYKDFCRQHGKRAPPFVALTAEPDQETCRSFDIDRCLPKPLTSQCAKRELQAWLAHSRLHQPRHEERPIASIAQQPMQDNSLGQKMSQTDTFPPAWQLLPPWSPQQSTQVAQPHIQRRLSDERQKSTKLQKQASSFWSRRA